MPGGWFCGPNRACRIICAMAIRSAITTARPQLAIRPLRARGLAGSSVTDSLLLTGAVDLEIEQGRAVGARNVVTAHRWCGQDPGRLRQGASGALWRISGAALVAGTAWRVAPGGRIDRFLARARPANAGSRRAWGRAGIQICYEIVFSGQVVDRDNRPDYIFNPSNDGWFGSWGPPQHLAQARMRAIEEGLPVLRSTTTGISAVIDARGVVRDHIGMHRAARMDGLVPPARAPTLFSPAWQCACRWRGQSC